MLKIYIFFIYILTNVNVLAKVNNANANVHFHNQEFEEFNVFLNIKADSGCKKNDKISSIKLNNNDNNL